MNRWGPWCDRDRLRDELILAYLIGAGPASGGLAVDTPEDIYRTMMEAAALFNEPGLLCNQHAMDAMYIWAGFVGWNALLGPHSAIRARANFSIGEAFAASC